MAVDQLSTLITYNPTTISTGATLEEAIRLLEFAGFHHLPVVDHDQLVGMVSDLDIVRAVAAQDTAKHSPSGSTAVVVEVQPISEIMTRRVISIRHDDSPSRALRLMLDNRIHSLPVLEEDRLIGLITSSDFVREFSYGQTDVSRHLVQEHMTPPVEEIDVNASLDEAYAQMRLSSVDELCVLEGNLPLGIVSSRDVRGAKWRYSSGVQFGNDVDAPAPDSLCHLISRTPVVRPGNRLCEAAATMHDSQLQAVAVMNQANRLLGVVTEENLLSLMLEHAC